MKELLICSRMWLVVGLIFFFCKSLNMIFKELYVFTSMTCVLDWPYPAQQLQTPPPPPSFFFFFRFDITFQISGWLLWEGGSCLMLLLQRLQFGNINFVLLEVCLWDVVRGLVITEIYCRQVCLLWFKVHCLQWSLSGLCSSLPVDKASFICWKHTNKFSPVM